MLLFIATFSYERLKREWTVRKAGILFERKVGGEDGRECLAFDATYTRLRVREVLYHLHRSAGPSNKLPSSTMIPFNCHSSTRRCSYTILYGSPRLCEAIVQWMHALKTRTATAKMCHCGFTYVRDTQVARVQLIYRYVICSG